MTTDFWTAVQDNCGGCTAKIAISEHLRCWRHCWGDVMKNVPWCHNSTLSSTKQLWRSCCYAAIVTSIKDDVVCWQINGWWRKQIDSWPSQVVSLRGLRMSTPFPRRFGRGQVVRCSIGTATAWVLDIHFQLVLWEYLLLAIISLRISNEDIKIWWCKADTYNYFYSSRALECTLVAINYSPTCPRLILCDTNGLDEDGFFWSGQGLFFSPSSLDWLWGPPCFT
jgi:hypothetical protein